MEDEKIKNSCNCNDDCHCEDECNCGNECTCDDCNCDDNCDCNGECTCDNCNCDDECTCDDCNCTDENKCDDECDCCNEKDKKHKHHEKHNDKIKELEDKIKFLEEQVLREKAESINFKKRKEEETNRILKFCNEDLVKDMLPTIDSLERAIKMDDNNLEDEVSKFLSGVKMIYCNQVNILEKYGVKAIDGSNKPFDPTYHQAVMTEKQEGIEPGMVLEVLQKGYLLKDRVIRPAMVKVSD